MSDWDKKLAQKLREEGLTHPQAMFVVGIVAEEKQRADREGYKRGYNNGHRDALEKANGLKRAAEPDS